MEYIALYRKYRPKTFLEVVGQEHITKTLKNQVKNKRVAHAYLFNGPRGTGKTSVAKILSRAINCLDIKEGDPCNACDNCRGILDGSILDVIEIDAASNNSVDNIRNIRDEIMYTPSKAKYKVYIIDEVHMLSTGAFNALLKTLEEPPPHAIFILATTEPQKLPSTIISRCQRYDFRRIDSKEIFNKLKDIIKEINVLVDEDALNLISRICDGGLRDALSILDQSISISENVNYQDVLNIVGMIDEEVLFDISEKINKCDAEGAILLVNDIYYKGKEINYLILNLIDHYRNILLAKRVKNLEGLVQASKEGIERLISISKNYEEEKIIYIINLLSETLTEAKRTTFSKILLETAIIKICSHEISQKEDKDIQSNIKTEVQKEAQKDVRKEKEQTSNTITAQCNKSNDVIASWSNIVNDLSLKGQSKIITQCLKDIPVDVENNTLMIYVPYNGEFYNQKLQEKKIVEEIKDSILKVTGKELGIKFKRQQEQEEKNQFDEFKEMASQRGFAKLVNEF